MDNFFRQKESDSQQSNRFLTVMQISAISRSLLNWLAGLLQLTEEEQNDAGIYYPADQRYK